jgi:hypothetical protein
MTELIPSPDTPPWAVEILQRIGRIEESLLSATTGLILTTEEAGVYVKYANRISFWRWCKRFGVRPVGFNRWAKRALDKGLERESRGIRKTK